MNADPRPDGFYWVDYGDGKPEILRHSQGYWSTCGSDDDYNHCPGKVIAGPLQPPGKIGPDASALFREFPDGSRVRATLDIIDGSGIEIAEGTGGSVESQDGPLVRVRWDRWGGDASAVAHFAGTLATLASNLEPDGSP